MAPQWQISTLSLNIRALNNRRDCAVTPQDVILAMVFWANYRIGEMI